MPAGGPGFRAATLDTTLINDEIIAHATGVATFVVARHIQGTPNWTLDSSPDMPQETAVRHMLQFAVREMDFAERLPAAPDPYSLSNLLAVES